MRRALHDLSRGVFVVGQDGGWGVGVGGSGRFGEGSVRSGEGSSEGLPIIAYAPAMRVSQLGDASFCADHGVRFAYMTGAMANGIASVDVVSAAVRAGCLGSFGAAGLRVGQIESAIDRLQEEFGMLTGAPARVSMAPGVCFNLIHSPNEMAHEMGVVELYLRRGVRLVEAAAFLDLTLPAVLYRVSGIHRGADGEVVAPNKIIAKVSRVEVATKWFSPPPEKMLRELVGMGKITAEQAEMAAGIPMAQDLTAEADSAGHTDNRPALTLLPTMLALRDRMQEQFGYDVPLRVGLGGGIGTPAAAAAAYAMGAAYVVTGSVNQACVESGSSDKVRGMLAQVQQADVIMAPAADMFEMGVKLQVIKRGTMFPMRAAKLYELYRAYGSIEEIPQSEREAVEKTIFREPLAGIWEKTKGFFREIDPSHIERAERDPKHKMALVFRWYLGLSSRWANAGETARVVDYQVWCGPAMGAFNEWTKGTFLEEPGNRRVGVVAINLLHGAAVVTRLNALRSQGVGMDVELARVGPVSPDAIEDQLR
ncbi:MAG: PfaD family polyunsaturated fatty acid/polyketide biosynthesis protein [Phycisphaerae bacterium]